MCGGEFLQRFFAACRLDDFAPRGKMRLEKLDVLDLVVDDQITGLSFIGTLT